MLLNNREIVIDEKLTVSTRYFRRVMGCIILFQLVIPIKLIIRGMGCGIYVRELERAAETT